jgi:hypothetical protein
MTGISTWLKNNGVSVSNEQAWETTFNIGHTNTASLLETAAFNAKKNPH